MKFLTPLVMEDINGQSWKTVEDFIWVSKRMQWVVIPAGFITDFATIPQPLSKVLRSCGDWDKATLVHDFVYSKKCDMKFSRKECDDLFLEAMNDCGVGYMTSRAMYLAVRVFGGLYFKKQ
jgi:hypothetical protein